MLEDEFKELLHRIALALGIAHGHPDPAAYAAGVVAAQESVTTEVKEPDPVAGDEVLTDGTEWPAPVVEELPVENNEPEVPKESVPAAE